MTDNACAVPEICEYKFNQILTKLDKMEADREIVRAQQARLDALCGQSAMHAVTLYGAAHDAGLVAEMREAREDRARRNRIWATVLSIIGANIALLWKLLLGKDGG
jgi:hypothetical protein